MTLISHKVGLSNKVSGGKCYGKYMDRHGKKISIDQRVKMINYSRKPKVTLPKLKFMDDEDA